MSVRRFTCEEGTSKKFWEIVVEGEAVTTRWGRIGTDGQSKTKTYPSADAAMKDADKQVGEKTKKGYVEVDGAEAAPFDAVRHFRFLIDTPGFEPVYDAIFARVTGARSDGKTVTVAFGPEHKLYARPPANASSYKKWPKTFQAIMAKHESLSFPEDGGWCLNLGESGNFETEYLESSELSEYTGAIQVPLSDYSDWWLYHPEETNAHGEAGLAYFSHETCDVDAPIELNAGALFLRRMAEILELELELEIPDGAEAVAQSAEGGLMPLVVGGAQFGPGLKPVFSDPASERLFTVHAETMSVWSCKDAANPVLLGEVKLPRRPEQVWGGFQTEFVSENDLILFDGNGWFRFDLTNAKEPKLAFHFGADKSRAASTRVGDQVIFYHYLYDDQAGGDEFDMFDEEDGEDGESAESADGWGIQSLEGDVESIRHFHPQANAYPQSRARIGDRLFMLGQDRLRVFDVETPSSPHFVDELEWDGSFFKMFARDQHNTLVVLESGNDNKYGLAIIDVSGKPKRGDRILKNHVVKAHHLVGDDLWLALHDKKRRWHLAHVSLKAAAPTLVKQVPLSLKEDDFISWMQVREGRVVFLLNSGKRVGFVLP